MRAILVISNSTPSRIEELPGIVRAALPEVDLEVMLASQVDTCYLFVEATRAVVEEVRCKLLSAIGELGLGVTRVVALPVSRPE